MIYNSFYELTGNTPVLKLNNIIKKFSLKADIYAKLEFFNPTGSVKDRAAFAMIKAAEEKGLINKDTVIIEPTSGNTGIGLASVCAQKGYKLVLTMPETMSVERVKFFKFLGAEVILTKGADGMAGSIEKASGLKKTYKNSFIPMQFENTANVQIHKATTGREIYKAFGGEIDIFIAGIGSGGTVTGVAKYLKGKNKDIKIAGIEPFESPFLTKNIKGAHGIQGIGAGFKPKILDLKLIDEIITVKSGEAFEYAALLAKTEGIPAGISSGAALYAAIKLAQSKENSGKNIVTLFPDGIDRYLSVIDN